MTSNPSAAAPSGGVRLGALRERRRFPGWQILILAALSAGCGPTAYMRATGAYSEAVKAGTEAFGAEFDLALVQCHRRAQLDRAHHLMEGADNIDPAWKAHWGEHCKDIENAIELHRRSTDQVAAYADALKKLADSTSYDGDGPKDAAAGAGALVGTFAGKDSAEAKYAAAVAEPLKLLAGFVLNQYATYEIKNAVHKSSPDIRAIFKAMKGYYDASELQLFVYESEVKKFFDWAEERVRLDPNPPCPPRPGVAPPRKVPPLEAIQFVRETELLAAELDAAHTRHKALGEVLAKLTEAEDKLEKAGEGDDKELAAVITSAVEVGKAVKTVLDAPNAKE